MKKRHAILIPSLLSLTMLSACALATPRAAVNVPTSTSTATPAATSPSTPELATSTVQPIQIQSVATSRGPNLEATDPNSVSLASGQLQLVEFFRFT